MLTRLRGLLMVFFLALAIPSVVLIHQAYRQMQWEAFHQQRLLAEELGSRIDRSFQAMTEEEESRGFADYQFLVVSGDSNANFLQRSPLSAFPPERRFPGLLAHFQVDASGVFSTPLLPDDEADLDSLGIPGAERDARLALGRKIHGLLGDKNLVRRQEYETPATEPAAMPAAMTGESTDSLREAQAQAEPLVLEEQFDDKTEVQASEEVRLSAELKRKDSQVAFDELKKSSSKLKSVQRAVSVEPQSLGRVADLGLDDSYAAQAQQEIPAKLATAQPENRSKRKEQALVLETEQSREGGLETVGSVPVSTFDAEIDPFSFALLDDRHFVLFRNVWRDGERYVQGAVIERVPFINQLIETAFRATALSRVSDLVIGYQTEVLQVFPALAEYSTRAPSTDLVGSLLYRVKLSSPFSDLELIFSVKELPLGPGGTVIIWSAAILFVVLVAGFIVMYRLGVGQIRLHRQQQDFVSAVSHELKTPLTSIRMYGEMLRAGWVDEEKKRSYYDFIFHESERLSRLIANVLQLARMTRSRPAVDCKPIQIQVLLDMIESKVKTQVQHAGFSLLVDGDGMGDAEVSVDADAFSQIFINLVDNAIKFSNGAGNQTIELSAGSQSGTAVVFSVRDFGPGIAKDQLKKIFKLFYRPESELTRETVGTGIGLALVHQLASAMRGKVDVINKNPGAQFRVTIPRC